MSDDRLPTSLWVDGHLHALTARGIPYYIVNKGEYSSGMVMVKIINPREACMLLSQQRDLDGKMGWVHALGEEVVEEKQADAYIARSVERDPDVWVIEVESRDMSNPFDGDIFEV